MSSDTAIRWPRLLCCTYKIPGIVVCAAGKCIVSIFRVSWAHPVQAVSKCVSPQPPPPPSLVFWGGHKWVVISSTVLETGRKLLGRNTCIARCWNVSHDNPICTTAFFFFFQISSRKVLTLRCLSADILGKHRALDWILNVFRVVCVGFLDNCTKRARKPCWWTFLWRFWPQKCQNANVVESTTQHYAGFYLYAWSKCNHSCKLARGSWSVRACFFLLDCSDSCAWFVWMPLCACVCPYASLFSGHTECCVDEAGLFGWFSPC